MTHSIRALLAVVLALALSACAVEKHERRSDGQGGTVETVWKLLGQRKVNFKADRDVIPVTVLRGGWRKVRLEVKQRGVEFLDLEIHFGNGDVHDVALRNFIPKGGKTRVIDLPGEARVIKKVVMVYKSRGKGRGRATVQVWGRR